MLNWIAASKTATLNCKKSEISRALERCSSQASHAIGQDQGWNPWVSHSGSLGLQSKKITFILLAEKVSLVFREHTKRCDTLLQCHCRNRGNLGTLNINEELSFPRMCSLLLCFLLHELRAINYLKTEI